MMLAQTPDSPSWWTPGRMLLIAGMVTLLLLALIGVALFNLPPEITVTVSAPAGATVVSHFVIDGRAESHSDTVPVSYHFTGHRFAYAVIPLSASAGQVHVELMTTKGTGGNAIEDGVTGVVQGNRLFLMTTIGGMTARHVDSMRAAVTQEPPSTSE